MLLTSVVIVLREVLEAALMISILLAMSRRLGLGMRWLAGAIIVGIAGAIVYAQYLGAISELFDGFGQEYLNATLQVGIFVGLLVIVFLAAKHRDKAPITSRPLPAAMAVAVFLAVTLEGAEIIVFVAGFLQMRELLSSVAFGALAGGGIGFSVGVLFYYILLAIPPARAFWISLGLLGFVAASMCMQACKLLIQADVLSAAGPIWNSSWLVAESSLPGQLLYALVGYEASPSQIEVFTYAGSLALVAAAVLVGDVFSSKQDQKFS